MERITSLKNPRVIQWRSLKDRKGRKETGCFLVEGYKMVQEAVHSRFPIEALLFSENRMNDRDTSEIPFPVYLLPDNVLAAVCNTMTPQGIAAIVRMTEASGAGERLVVLDGVQDPGNVGTIIRTADAAGFDGVLLSAQCADVFGPKALRATMGSVFRMPLRVTDNLPAALEGLKAEGYSVLSSQLDGEPFDEVAPAIPEPFALVIGSEGNGVTDPVRALATHRVALPMRGGAESLNAAVAAGIMMYGLMRGRA